MIRRFILWGTLALVVSGFTTTTTKTTTASQLRLGNSHLPSSSFAGALQRTNQRQRSWIRFSQSTSSNDSNKEEEEEDVKEDVSSTTTTSATTTTKKSTSVGSRVVPLERGVESVEKFARLPVWPVLNGLFLFVVSRLLGNTVASEWEDRIGGRVCPNFFSTNRADPFIMLVHHCHTFAPWDPLRYIQRALILPEGFPAHPHRGFVTVTYFLKGGFRHRDSMGIQQTYGAQAHNHQKHTQWLTTGAGILHEEMFDNHHDEPSLTNGFDWFPKTSSHELYQLWLNLPARDKLMSPRIDLLGGPDETPIVTTTTKEEDQVQTETVVIAGTHQNQTSTAPVRSDVTILHVRMKPGSVWGHEFPINHETAIVYMRQGRVDIVTTTATTTSIDPHHTAYLQPFGKRLTVQTEKGADFLLLAGEPLREPVSAQGSMVMNTPDQINNAYSDYQQGLMGLPWDHKLTDEEWKQHVQMYPSRFTVQNDE